ncbi:hypothetical protein PGTUg99_016089 [Puccinia graminis f. sp. tritici]|uniref:RING-type domain-containing protein n=1 Tax=Puccinia graminis f. sp. tritici TaxID=56615 RepID=A0A5B0SKD4_PUCGR|nr:hypothetical protein PGTUg99_016089 [Puccinia graminis f. sp. tritici]
MDRSWMILLILVGPSLGAGGEQELARFVAEQDVEAVGGRWHSNPCFVDRPLGPHHEAGINEGGQGPAGRFATLTPHPTEPSRTPDVVLRIDDDEEEERWSTDTKTWDINTDRAGGSSENSLGGGPARMAAKEGQDGSGESSRFKPIDAPECAICLSKLDPVSKPMITWDCGHSFDKHCIESWLWIEKHWKKISRHTCPVCRAALYRNGVPAKAPEERPHGLPPLSSSAQEEEEEEAVLNRPHTVHLEDRPRIWLCDRFLYTWLCPVSPYLTAAANAFVTLMSITVMFVLLDHLLPRS